jgi:hypothetical protein
MHLLFPCRVFLKPIILLFSVGTLGYLHRLPLYYKSLVYYCLGLVVKSPVLYPFSLISIKVLYSLIHAAVSCVASKIPFFFSKALTSISQSL